jgi:secretion/DNA translocation related CpaE-like protein
MIPVLLVTRHDAVRDAVLRLAALAGTPVHLEDPGPAARAVWRAAGLVVVGPDGLDDVGLPRRESVVVVSDRPPDPPIWQRALALGAEVVLTLPDGESGLLDVLAVAGEPIRPRGVVVGVMGGCGGAGASTLAAALGMTAARNGTALLIDGDVIGGGLDLVLGVEHSPGARWPDLVDTRGRLSAPALLDALPQLDGLAVLSWDRGDAVALPAEAAASVLDAATRAVTTVVVDLPRQLGAAGEVLLSGCDELLMVVPATVRGAAAAARVVNRVATVVPVAGVVVRDATAPRLAPAEVAAALGLELRGSIPDDSGIAGAAQRGRPPLSRPRGSLHGCCRSLLRPRAETAEAA